MDNYSKMIDFDTTLLDELDGSYCALKRRMKRKKC